MNGNAQGIHVHSGRMGTSLVLVPMAALIAAFLLGVGYAYVDVYSPIVGYISLLFVVLFGAGLAFSISKIGFFAKCRNSAFLRLVGLASGLLAFYVSWAAFSYALLGRYDEEFTASLSDVISSPAGVLELAKTINAEGWYSVMGWTPTGMILWLFWGVEAFIVVLAPVVMATMAIDDQVFCEHCNLWCDRTEGAVALMLPETEATLQDLRPDHLSPLETLPLVANRDLPHLRIDSWECGRCRNTTALQLKMSAKVTDDDGKVEEKTEDVTAIWTVTTRDLHKVRSLGRQPRPAAQATQAASAGM